MCEDLRCNVQLKQMTVWTDEAHPKSDLLNTAQHQKFSNYSAPSVDMKDMRTIYRYDSICKINK